MKTKWSYCLIVSLILTLIISAFTSSTQANAALQEDYIKAANGKYHVINAYDTLRGANQLVVYTPQYGDSTKNNRWGIEVVVRSGIITEVRDGVVDGNADASIPEDGYVISGHGTARTWILDNLHKEDPVELLKDVILEPVKESTITVTDINPLPPYEFPGGRGANEMIVYTPDYGQKRTGTNQYGYEIIVRNGIVTDSGSNNSLIPSDGFVISGHGTAKDWLISNTQVGAEVELDEATKSITVRIDAKSYINASNLVVRSANDRIRLAEEQLLDAPIEKARDFVSESESLLKQAKDAYEAEKWQLTIDLAEQAAQKAEEAMFHTVESDKVDARGVWHRPVEKNRAEVIATLDRLEKANYNMIFLETFFHGYTIYPSAVAEQNPSFEGWDPLQVFIEEARKRGIEVHAWVHTFFVGHESLNPPGPILRKHPDWAAVDREGRIPSQKEVGYYWVNPALPAVRDYLSSVFREMTSSYELDGLHLDYIRYPVSQPIEVGYSYDDYSRSQFKKLYGTDPLEITPEDDPELWEKWNQWREEQITTFVKRIYGEVKEINPDILLSTAVFPEVSEAIDKKFQNWVEWAEEGYLDFLTPMVYSMDKGYVQNTSRSFIEKLKQPVLSYIGIAPFMGFNDRLLVNQIDAVGHTGALGQVQFAYHTLSEDHFKAVVHGPQRQQAVVPHRHPVQASLVIIEEIERKMNDIYVAKGALTEAQKAPVEKKLNEIELALSRGDLDHASNRIADLSKFVTKRQLNKIVEDHLLHQLNELASVVKFAIYQQ